MRTRTIVDLVVCSLLFAVARPAEANLRIVGTTPDLAALARAIGGDKAQVDSIGKPNEDPHFVQAKPSFIVTLNKADLLIENGLQLELGWLPALIDQTRNGKIRVGAPGRVLAVQGVPLLEIPTEPVTRAMGDIHPGGNPHFLVDPQRGKIVAENIYQGLARVAPADAEEFRGNLARLQQEIDSAEAECQRMMAPYRGTKVVTYHKSLTYFCTRFGLEEVGTIEPKPGIPPSGSHITALIAQMKQTDAKLILMEPWHERRTPALVAKQTGAKVVELSTHAGGASDMPDYPSVCRGMVTRIVAALEAK